MMLGISEQWIPQPRIEFETTHVGTTHDKPLVQFKGWLESVMKLY